MGLFEHWPYTNFHDLNLDWIIKEIPKVYTSRDEAQASAEASAESAAASQLSADASRESAESSALSAEESAGSAASISGKTEQIDTNTARINNIIVQGTPTEGNAELIDIRVGADGITYPTAGNAVRGQYTDINNKILPIIGKTDISVTTGETRGKFISDLGDERTTSANFAHSAPIQVSKNKQYFFKAAGTPIMAAICECDSDGNNRVVKNTYSATDVQEIFNYLPDDDGYIMLSYNYSTDVSMYSTSSANISDFVDVAERNSEIIQEISEENTNLVDFSHVEYGVNWTTAASAGRACLYIEAKPFTKYLINTPAQSIFYDVNCVEKTSKTSTAAIRATNITSASNFELETQSTTKVLCIQFAKRNEETITPEDFDNWNLTVYNGNYSETAYDRIARQHAMPWKDKKLVWLGTSIPAAGKYDPTNEASYPLIVGNLLDATVINEAVGSSALHCKDPARISAANPYGFTNNFEAASRCLTNSIEEMNWIIAHYNDSSVFTQNVPASLSDADKEFIRSCSWEIKIQQYLNSDDFPDAWIFDHGHNDLPTAASEATYTEKEAMNGTRHDGYYNGGVFVESTASSYIEYDVTDQLYVWLSGTFGSYYDFYDLYDSNENNIGILSNGPTQTTKTDILINVANATTLRVSNVNTLLSTVTVNKLKYPMYNSLYSYQGAFDFIVNKILTYNPKARIIMIGEYENQKFPSISENQMIASERWLFPLYKQWNNLAFSQQLILDNGTWKKMLNIIIPDNLHPHSDSTGYATDIIAKNIAAWLETISC